MDPRPNVSISVYACFANNPILVIDALGDTTYRFNKSDGSYIGMFNLESKGQLGSYGDYKIIGEGDEQVKLWTGNHFNFADPINDSKQIRDGVIKKLLFVNKSQIQNILIKQGAFKYGDRNNFWKFKNNSSGGAKFDYSYSIIPVEFAIEGASSDPLNIPSPMLFLPTGSFTAHNHMNFGNFL